ncbi:MAG: internal scaffolding protein [Microvirus sp.]|nr:MAG: internal scaffolding protein [Microvirus sp.]
MKIYTQYDPPPSPSVDDWGPSKTRQEFKDEADINNIIDQYQTNGILPETKPEGVFGDFSDPVLKDYQMAENIVVGARELFERLPARIRERFQNDAASLIEFVQDDNNRDEAIKLGIINKPVAPPATPAVAPATELNK